MDQKSVKVEVEENRAPKQGLNSESVGNKVPEQVGSEDEKKSEQTYVEQSSKNQGEENRCTVSTHQSCTSLSHEEEDVALPRALQDQMVSFSRWALACWMAARWCHVHLPERSSGSDEEEDEDGELASTRPGSENRGEIDSSQFPGDESDAWALQESYDFGSDYPDNYDSEDESWSDFDPDEMLYENTGLSWDRIASLPSSSYVADQSASSSCDKQCVICCAKYEAGDNLVGLPCKHKYHMDCIRSWLRVNEVCPLCRATCA